MLVTRVLVVQPREALARMTARELGGSGFEPSVVAAGEPPVVAYGRPGDASRAMLLGAATCVHDRGAVVGALRRLRQPVAS